MSSFGSPMSNKRSRSDSGGGGGTATTNAAAGHGTPSSMLDTPSRAGTGLRHFSMRVCKKVQEKVTTSYNEVADELVAEFIEQRRTEISEAGGDPDVELPPPRKKPKSGETTTSSAVAAPKATKAPPGYRPTGMAKGYDEKNIRRRVYDALNVLMAMDIIEKEGKKITWKGLPNTAPHDLDVLQRERRMRLEDIREKQERLQELLVQNVCFANLVKHNREAEEKQAAEAEAAATAAAEEDKDGGDNNGTDQSAAGRDPPPKSAKAKVAPKSDQGFGEGGDFKVQLPFIVVNTSNSAVIKCEMDAKRTGVKFDFSLPFEINDDNEILKRMQLDKTTTEEASKLFPRDIFTYAQEHKLLEPVLVSDEQIAAIRTGTASTSTDATPSVSTAAIANP
mmetsp:Transcript_33530/g.98796  ORF Transcript_33530/g.98796 Transcript_33530/m.98796 type:complete len:393 (-) Transcript_33530:465-1643(-)